MIRVGVVTFPGSNGDMDCIHALERVEGVEPSLIWHKDTELQAVDALVLPGGFSYGDYLRAGAIAQFSPVMRAVRRFADSGGPVLGICNGFQILTEAGLLPGALLRNQHILFRCAFVHVRVTASRGPWLGALAEGDVLRLAVAHGQGNYFADADTLRSMQEHGQIVMQYSEPDGTLSTGANHNGSLLNIAAVTNRAGNVLGMMPHPERSSDLLLGSADGEAIFSSLVHGLVRA